MIVADADVLKVAEAWARSGKGVALATVIETWGSAPWPPGSRLVATLDGEFFGSVSGGCVEGEVLAQSEEVIRTGVPKLLTFGVKAETAWRAGLACGGRISVYVEPVTD
jgi:xanthine/CO dehydrogenase XdhC/CoxF family maturation factor